MKRFLEDYGGKFLFKRIGLYNVSFWFPKL